MKVEVAILGLPSQMVLMDCAHKATLNLNLAENQFFLFHSCWNVCGGSSLGVPFKAKVLRLGFLLR